MSVTVKKLFGKSVIDFIDKVQRSNDDRKIGTDRVLITECNSPHNQAVNLKVS